ncbi:ArnT family glycosyltransferase [Spirochaetota bacterium]
MIDKYCNSKILIACIWVLLCGFFTSQLTLRDFPNSGDEYSYLISAKLFSDGKLSVPSPRNKKFYDLFHIINDGKFYGKFSPGWPFFLMFGVLIGFPGIVNVLFAVLTLVVMYGLAREIFSEKTANISLILMATSPYFILNSSSYFSHPSSLFFNVLFVYLYFKNLQREKRFYFLLSGIILGISFLIRQLDAVVIAFCLFIHYIYFFRINNKIIKEEISRWLLYLSGFLFIFGIFLIYNYLQTGDSLLTPFNKHRPYEKLGLSYPYFESFKWAIKNNIFYRFVRLNIWIPFCFVFIFPVLFFSKRFNREYLYLMIGIFASILLAYFFWLFNPVNQYGPRYLYSSLFAIILLMAVGIEDVMARKWKGSKFILPGTVIINMGLFIFFSFQFHSQVNMRMTLYDEVKKRDISNAIVFLNSPSGSMHVLDLTRNGIYFNNQVLYVRNIPGFNRLIMDEYPGRKFYLWKSDYMKIKDNRFLKFRKIKNVDYLLRRIYKEDYKKENF